MNSLWRGWGATMRGRGRHSCGRYIMLCYVTAWLGVGVVSHAEHTQQRETARRGHRDWRGQLVGGGEYWILTTDLNLPKVRV